MKTAMTLRDVIELTGAELLTGEEVLDKEIVQACAADLLSDVLALVRDEGVLLVTGSLAPQVVRVAEVLGLGGLLVVRGKRPSEAMVEYARQASLPLLTTDLSMFEACGVLYSSGMGGALRKRFPRGDVCQESADS